MIDNNVTSNDGGSRPFSDETIRRFLLGGLSASERPLFEQRLITDDDLDTRVRLAELDLADDYAFERLNSLDRELFEQKFLLTSIRQQQVQVSKALRDRFSSTAATSAVEHRVPKRLRDLFGLSRPARRIAFGVLILLIVFGTAWLLIREPRIVRQIANRLDPRRLPERSTPREAHHPTNQSSPEHTTTPSPMPEHDQTASPPVAVTVALRPAVSPRPGEMPAFDLPKGDQGVVRLQLAKPVQPGPYRAELLTNEGSWVFSANSLKPDDSATEIDFDVPVRLLKSGNYQVKLIRIDGGSRGSVANYYFRVP